MLDIGWSELLMVAIVAIVVVGPKELPKLMRTFGVYASKIRRAAADFQRQFDEAVAESEADEVRKNIEAIRSNMGTAADFGVSPDKPLMTPTTPAPRSIERAIAPQSQASATPAKKTPAKRKTSTKQKTSAKQKTTAKTKAAPKKSTSRARTKTTAKTAAKRTAKAKSRPKAKTRPKAKPRTTARPKR